MIDEGFIKIHRKILKWEWYEDINVFKLFLHCLILANHRPKSWQGTIVQRGEFVSSLGNLGKGSGLSVQEVRTALKKLKSTNEISVTSTNRFTMIKVNEYSTYHINEKESNTHSNKQTTNKQQTSNKQSTTTKNVKKVKNVKKIKNKEEEEEKELIFPECVSRDLVEKYIQNRVDIKKTMTHNAKELFLTKIQKFHDTGEDVEDLITKAIIAGWSDIYRAKGNENAKDYRGRKRQPVEKAKTKTGDESKYIEGRKTTYTKID